MLIIINGPLIKELGFNYTQGVMRDGYQANTSIGRFWRLYMRNIAGFLPHKNDKATFGGTWRVVVAENEDVVNKIGWESNCVEMGFKAGTLAAGGWSKQDLKRALYDKARFPARHVERMLRDWTLKTPWNLAHGVKSGHLPRIFHESDDPDRLVPILWEPEDFMIIVTGDLGRNSAFIFAHQGVLEYPTAKEIRLPASWQSLRSENAVKKNRQRTTTLRNNSRGYASGKL